MDVKVRKYDIFKDESCKIFDWYCYLCYLKSRNYTIWKEKR